MFVRLMYNYYAIFVIFRGATLMRVYPTGFGYCTTSATAQINLRLTETSLLFIFSVTSKAE